MIFYKIQKLLYFPMSRALVKKPRAHQLRNPWAKAIGRENEFGSLSLHHEADITVLKVVPFEQTIVGKRLVK